MHAKIIRKEDIYLYICINVAGCGKRNHQRGDLKLDYNYSDAVENISSLDIKIFFTNC